MKTIATLAGGKVTLTEDSGVFTLAINESASVGGGEATGLVKVQGSGSVILDAQTGLSLGEALLNSHLPAAVMPLAEVVEGIVGQAVKAIE